MLLSIYFSVWKRVPCTDVIFCDMKRLKKNQVNKAKTSLHGCFYHQSSHSSHLFWVSVLEWRTCWYHLIRESLSLLLNCNISTSRFFCGDGAVGTSPTITTPNILYTHLKECLFYFLLGKVKEFQSQGEKERGKDM